jgi:outer membrane protein W
LKKIICSIAVLILFANISYGQIPVKPSLQVAVKGAYSSMLSHYEISEEVSGFPGVQLELTVDLNSQWGIYGNFGADFISLKNSTRVDGTTTYELKTSTQLSGYMGPRYYVNIPMSPTKVYFDAGLGIYSTKLGDLTGTTSTTNPPTTITASFSSVSQWGTNLGAGVNLAAGSNVNISLGAKYHFIFKSDDTQVTRTISTGTSSTLTVDAPEHSYIQFAAGIGYRFGL